MRSGGLRGLERVVLGRYKLAETDWNESVGELSCIKRLGKLGGEMEAIVSSSDNKGRSVAIAFRFKAGSLEFGFIYTYYRSP